MNKLPKVVDMILEQVEMEINDEWRPPRLPNSFRGSELGDCPRYIQYASQGYEGERPSPELGLLFRDGHLHHDALRSLLSRIGRVTNIEYQGSKSYTVEVDGETVQFTITCTTDGILNGDYIFDIKSINPFSFKKLSMPYIKENYKGYLYQLQAYFDVFDKQLGFNLFKDKAFGALKIFWYKRSPKMFNQILQKLDRKSTRLNSSH